MKEEGVNNNLKQRYAEGKKLRAELFEGKKRATAGLLFKASQLGLDNEVLNSQERKERLMSDLKELGKVKATEEYNTRKRRALEVLALNKAVADLGVKHLKALVHYKKRKDDAAVPSAKNALVARYNATCHRPEQSLVTYLSSVGHD